MIHLQQIDPIAIQIPWFELIGRTVQRAVIWYGIRYLSAVATDWWLGRRRVAAGGVPGVDANAFGDLLFYGMLGVVVGGRVGYVLFYALATFLRKPLML